MFKSKKDIQKLEENMKVMLDRLKDFDEDQYRQNIKNLINEIRYDLMIEQLKELPVNVLSTLEKDIPINVLSIQGVKTIYDLHNLTELELTSFDGIGPVSASTIISAIDTIKKSVINDVKLKINPDDLDEKSLKLLEAIYEKLVKADEYKELREKIYQLQADWKETVNIAKEKRGFFGRLFQTREEKEKIEEAFKKINSESFINQYKSIESHYNKVEEIDQKELVQHFIENNIDYYGEIERVVGSNIAKTTDDLPSEIVEEINQFPLNKTDLNLEFRNYQEFGSKYALYFKRTLLGDEMGLGKTVQGLGLINHLYQEGKKHSIVVCPLSLLSNWKREIERFSKLPVYIFHGKMRDRELIKWEGERGGVLLTTYEHTVHLWLNIDYLAALIVDEAHYVKNPEARRSINVYRLAEEAEYVLFMSGTPLENNIEEMKQLVTVLQSEIGSKLSEHLYLLEPSRFKETIQGVYLRRNRLDVLEELPELEIKEEWTNFSLKEAKIYKEAVENGRLMLMRRAAWLGGSPAESPKLERLLEICDRAKENGHKVIVFSFFKDVLNIVHKYLEERTYDVISGDVSNSRRQEIIDEFSRGESGAVLISQITAGGVGLNIQAANVVILCEPQWKPSIENQAISRAYRMGQARKVLVYRLLTEESIDESMLEILDYKSNLFDLYARESEITDVQVVETEESEERNVKSKVLEMEKQRLREKVS